MGKKQGRTFTDAFIRALKPKAKPYKLSEHAARGEGRLIVRVLPSSVREFFYRYRVDGGDKTLSLGRYDAEGRNGKTLGGIRKALSGSRELQRETGDVKEHQEAKATAAAALEAKEKGRGSLEQLLTAYVDHLKARGAQSWQDVSRIFKNHVIEPFPMLAREKAAEVKQGDIQRILAKMVKAGLTRQVNKARAYIKAAFTFGMASDFDPRTTSGEGVLFGLKVNPVASKPIREYEKAGNRVLSEDELRLYWKELEGLPAIQRAALRLNLSLACQRTTQLLRAGWPEFDLEEKTLLLLDSKGRGGSRDHLLPLTDFALEYIKPLVAANYRGRDSAPVFSSDGKRQMVSRTLTQAVFEISGTLKERNEVPAFSLGDLRRTAETMLQKMGIDKEVRAHLLSHGRSRGVQGKHYERYNFLPEKRAALEKWARHLERITTGKAATVTPIRAA